MMPRDISRSQPLPTHIFNVRTRVLRWWHEAREISVIVFHEMLRTRVFDNAASLAFWSILSLIPLLVVIGSVLSRLPLPNVMSEWMNLMAGLVPRDSLAMVEKIVSGILTQHHTGVVSLSVLGYLWSSTGAFASLIDTLDIACDVRVCRPWWRERVQALLLAFTSGTLITTSLLAILGGPHFGHFLTMVFPVPSQLAWFWPTIRSAIIFLTFVAAVELMYLLGPNVRQRFPDTLPGAVLAVGVWFPGSLGLSFYLAHFTHYNIAYGSLGAAISLMLWFYITALAVLAGAELNTERVKYRQRKNVSRK
jgi:membrane protein